MSNEPGTFLGLSGLAWSAISSMATVMAVIVALFLPFHYERKKKDNLSELIENEIESNSSLLRRADLCKEGNINGVSISRINLMCPILVNIDISIWNDNKQAIAEISSKRFLRYSEITKILENLKYYAMEINEKKGQSPYITFVEGEVKKCIYLIEKRKKDGKLSSVMGKNDKTQ